MTEPKPIEEITLEDLESHRWCYYQDDEKGYDGFEYVIPDSHTDFSDQVIEMELAFFTFSNGGVAKGMFDGSEGFHIFDGHTWFSMWHGVREPTASELENFSSFLKHYGFEMPVRAEAQRSRTSKSFGGLQYLSEEGDVCECAI
ncbi:hypothetical protein [Corallincola spongiicola]|uniref:Uncharacterized protein n=1 Tax=Corallincola spongiicola TaxID=2520508 RepID=A0ABY1WLE9_9GAMM|nr:hypothetical protein [Corallincola spongiicola]TAA41728.1 hypothetical protein EXY25_15920 [Corallincola spongiicola]